MPRGIPNKKFTAAEIREAVSKLEIVKDVVLPVVFPNAAGIKRQELEKHYEIPTEIVPQGTHCKNCHCPKDQHHGKDRDWCNVFGCLCQSFK